MWIEYGRGIPDFKRVIGDFEKDFESVASDFATPCFEATEEPGALLRTQVETM